MIRWLGGSLVGLLLTLTVGGGCGSVAAMDPQDCCKSICRHSGDSNDARKCCQQNNQTKPSLGFPLADITLAKKLFETVLFIDSHPLDRPFDGVFVNWTSKPRPKILKFPQQDLYKRTSALLI